MSEATARATRRQLRRVVGDVAGAALTEQARLIEHHDKTLALHSRFIQAQGDVIGQHTQDLRASVLVSKDHDQRVSAMESISTRFTMLNLWDRLRWLTTGHLT